MTHIITPHVYCPLCEAPMSRRQVQIKGKYATVYFCRPCSIGTFDFDPAFNKWRDADKKIPCANCHFESIRWFARYIDGYFKGFCPRCKAVMQSDVDVRFGDNDEIIIPEEMEEEKIEDPTEIQIPFSHLEKKFGVDKVKEFKDKKRRKKEDG